MKRWTAFGHVSNWLCDASDAVTPLFRGLESIGNNTGNGNKPKGAPDAPQRGDGGRDMRGRPDDDEVPDDRGREQSNGGKRR